MDAAVALEQLIRARRGDREAFASLIHAHRGQAFALARAALQHEGTALELLETSALEIWARRATWDGSFAEIWTRAIAEGIFARIRAVGDRWSESAGPLQQSRWHEREAERPIDPELRAAIRAAIARLPPTPRALLLLKDDAALSDAAIAQASHLEVDAVRRGVHAARCALTRAIDQHFASAGSAGAY